MPCIRNGETRTQIRSPFPASSSSSRSPSRSVHAASLSPSASPAFASVSSTPPPPPTLVPPPTSHPSTTSEPKSKKSSSRSTSSTPSSTAAASSSRSKSSHARKRQEGHIPRPSNAFIIFRSEFVSNQRIPTSIESHSQNLSRIAGQIWRSLSPSQKAPYVQKAKEAKEEHYKKFPGYEYHPTDSWSLRGRRKVRKGRGEGEVKEARQRCGYLAELVKSGKEGGELEKALTSTSTTTTGQAPNEADITSENKKENEGWMFPARGRDSSGALIPSHTCVDESPRIQSVFNLDDDIPTWDERSPSPESSYLSKSVPVLPSDGDENEDGDPYGLKRRPFENVSVDLSKIIAELVPPSPSLWPSSSSQLDSHPHPSPSVQESGEKRRKIATATASANKVRTRTKTGTTKAKKGSSTSTSTRLNHVSKVHGMKNHPIPASPPPIPPPPSFAPPPGPVTVLFNLPNTFIPPEEASSSMSVSKGVTSETSDSKLYTDKNLSSSTMHWPPFSASSSLSPLTQESDRSPKSDSDSEMETERLPLPSIQVPPSPALPSKIIDTRTSGISSQSFTFPGALHVPDKPRSPASSHSSSSGRSDLGTTNVNMNEVPGSIFRAPSSTSTSSVLPSKIRACGAPPVPSELAFHSPAPYDLCSQSEFQSGQGTALPKDIKDIDAKDKYESKEIKDSDSRHAYSHTHTHNGNETTEKSSNPWTLRQVNPSNPFPSRPSVGVAGTSFAKRTPVGIGSVGWTGGGTNSGAVSGYGSGSGSSSGSVSEGRSGCESD